MIGFKHLIYHLPQDLRRSIFARIKPKLFEYWQNKRHIDTKTGSSYMPFDIHRCLYFHIPKTAGIAINRSLFGNKGGDHSNIRIYQYLLSKAEFDSYYKFTFVRNPWDRVFSAYNFLIGGGMNQSDQDWADKHLKQYQGFNDFVVSGLTQPHVQKWIHFIPQVNFLYLPTDSRFHLNFLGFYENLNQDFAIVAKQLGMDGCTLRKENVTSHAVGKNYREFYSDESIETVAQIYRSDIKTFGYDFDSNTLDEQISMREGGLLSCQ